MSPCSRSRFFFYSISETELKALRSRNAQLEVIATEQKSKADVIDELNKEMSEKNKVSVTHAFVFLARS